MYHFAVHGKHAATGDVALEVVGAIDDGEPVSLRMLEHTHDASHGGGVAEDSSRLDHELGGLEMMVELGTEQDVADLDDVDFT